MRLAGQVKQGYYPAPPEAISGILKHLRVPVGCNEFCIIDPCAGEAKALMQLAEGLGSLGPEVYVRPYAVELNAARSARIKEAHPEIKLLGPCSLFHSRISARSFGLVYVNPPFDDELGGGGREEESFVSMAASMLAPKGILVLVVPYNQVFGKRNMCALLDLWFHHIGIYLFPDGHRRFRECVVFAEKRKSHLGGELNHTGDLAQHGIAGWSYVNESNFPKLGEHQLVNGSDFRTYQTRPRVDHLDIWTIPSTDGPAMFLKTELTDEEILGQLESSPLYREFEAVEERKIGQPPLSLSKGHTSILLLSGLLDGYVPSDPLPHVVRGSCEKQSVLVRTEENEGEDGVITEKKIYAELPVPVIRAVWPDGKIRTFSDKPADEGFVTCEEEDE